MKSLLKVLLLALAAVVSVCHADSPASGAGFRFTQMQDPISRSAMKAVVFYPADTGPSRTKLGPFDIPAQENAAVRKGRFPLVLLSHGNGGSMFGHHDMAAFLAHHGFIVAAIEHPGDNFRDQSGLGSDRTLIGRRHQLSALLDHVLGLKGLGDSIDPDRIGVAGFSAGGYTALLMIGAVPDFDLRKAYCQRQAKSLLCEGGGMIRRSVPPLQTSADPRIRAAFVMGGIGVFFDKASFSDVRKPVYLYAAANDEVLPPAENAERLKRFIPTLWRYTVVDDAGHFIFLAPCSPALKADVPGLCTDPPGVDREHVHTQLNREALTFFRTHM